MIEDSGSPKLLKQYILITISFLVFNLIVGLLPGQLSAIKQAIVFSEVGCAGYWFLRSERRVPIRILIWTSIWSMIILTCFFSEVRLPRPMVSHSYSNMDRFTSLVLSPAIWLPIFFLPATILLCSIFIFFGNWSLFSKTSNIMQVMTVDLLFATALISIALTVFMAICPYDGFLSELWEFLSDWLRFVGSFLVIHAILMIVETLGVVIAVSVLARGHGRSQQWLCLALPALLASLACEMHLQNILSRPDQSTAWLVVLSSLTTQIVVCWGGIVLINLRMGIEEQPGRKPLHDLR